MFTHWKCLPFFVRFPTVQVHMANMIPRLHHLVSMKTSPERFFTDSGNSANLTFVGHWQIAHHLAKTQNAIHQTQQNDIIEIEQYDTFQLKYLYTAKSRSTEIVCFGHSQLVVSLETRPLWEEPTLASQRDFWVLLKLHFDFGMNCHVAESGFKHHPSSD